MARSQHTISRYAIDIFSGAAWQENSCLISVEKSERCFMGGFSAAIEEQCGHSFVWLEPSGNNNRVS